MHQLTGDFYTVGEVLGHTLAGIGVSLGLSMNFEAVTARYVDVRLERKKEVLDAYHDAVGKTEPPKAEKAEPKKQKAKQRKKAPQKQGIKRTPRVSKSVVFMRLPGVFQFLNRPKISLYGREKFYYFLVLLLSNWRITLHGFPTATQFGGIVRFTTLPAPITLFSPMVTPGRRIQPPPIHTLSFISTGRA